MKYLTGCRVMRSIFSTKGLGVFAGSLLFGVNCCIVPKQPVSLSEYRF